MPNALVVAVGKSAAAIVLQVGAVALPLLGPISTLCASVVVIPVPPCPIANVPSIPNATALLFPPYIVVVLEAVPNATYTVCALAHSVAVAALPVHEPDDPLTFPVTFPVKLAVIVLAEKSPLLSRFTMVETILELVAYIQLGAAAPFPYNK